MANVPVKFSEYVFGYPRGVGVGGVCAVKRRVLTRAAGRLEAHRHEPDQLEILHLEKGAQTYFVEGRRYDMTGGDILIIRPGEEHSSGDAPEDKAITWWVTLDLSYSRGSLLGLPKAHGSALLQGLMNLEQRHFPGSPRITDLLYTVLRRLLRREPTPPNALQVFANLVLFLAEVLVCAAAGQRGVADGWVDKVKGFVSEHVRDEISSRDLARHMKMSHSRFILKFKRAMGMPSTEYILRKKIECAKAMLVESADRTVTDIGFELGFSSSQYFATVFRRYAGVSPVEFRSRR